MSAYEFTKQVIGKRHFGNRTFTIEKRHDKGIIITKDDVEDQILRSTRDFRQGFLIPINLEELETKDGAVIVRVPQEPILNLFTEDEQRKLATLSTEHLEIIKQNAMAIFDKYSANGNTAEEKKVKVDVDIEDLKKLMTKAQLKEKYLELGLEFNEDWTVAKLKSHLLELSDSE